MCDNTPTIRAQLRPMTAASRRNSNISCNGGRRGGSRPASATCSQQNVRNQGINMQQAYCPPTNCCNQARPDCCNIPCCKPPLPKCPEGMYVERTQPIRPDRVYLPPTIPFDALSSYREQFHLKCGPRSQSYKPASTFEPSQARMDGMSSYREAYTPKHLLSYQKPPWAVKAQFTPSDAKMEGSSTYRVDYQAVCSVRPQSLKPLSTFDPSQAKMDGISTYRQSFIPYCTREYDYAKQPQYKKQVAPAFSCAPMEGTSTYRSDFWPKCCAKRRSLKPGNRRPGFSDSKFADCTTYRNDFNPFHFEKCVGQCIPAQVYDEMFPNCGIMGCGPDEPRPKVEEEMCPPMPGCCPGGPIRYPGSCGNEMGLFPGKPLPECCQPDPVPADALDGGGDC